MGEALDRVLAAAPKRPLLPSGAPLRDWAAGHDGNGHAVLPEVQLAAQAALGAEGPRAEEDYENRPRGLAPRDEERGEDWDEADWDDVRSHLESRSPWFASVMRGESPGDPAHEVRLTPRTAEASTVHEPTVPPGGPGLFHMKGHQLPAYVQHLYKHLVGKYGKHRAYGVAIGIVKKWAAGINPGGKGKGHHVHADVRAAAARNVADWEKEKAEAHAHHADKKVAASAVELAAPAAWPSGKPYKESLLPPGPTTGLLQGQQTRPGVIVNAPGTKPLAYGQLRQAPAQTVAASPPLPPGTKLPTQDDMTKLAATVPDGADITLANSVRKHLSAAGEKLKTGDNVGALSALRSAQAGAHSAYRAAQAANLPHMLASYARGGFNANVPPAEQSSATAAMAAGRDLAQQYRGVHHEIARHIDTIRRSWFHGAWNGAPEARFTGALEAVLALAEVRGYVREEEGKLEHVRPYLDERSHTEHARLFRQASPEEMHAHLADPNSGHAINPAVLRTPLDTAAATRWHSEQHQFRAKLLKGSPSARSAVAEDTRTREERLAEGAKYAAQALPPKLGSVPLAERFTEHIEPEWQRALREQGEKARAAAESNAKAQLHNMALAQARRTWLHETTGLNGNEVAPAILGPDTDWEGLKGAQQALWEGRFGDADATLRAEVARLQAAHKPRIADRVEKARLKVEKAVAARKDTLPPLAQVGPRNPDGTLTAIDHEGNLHIASLQDGVVTVTRDGRSESAPAGENATQTARELAGKLREPAPAPQPSVPPGHIAHTGVVTRFVKRNTDHGSQFWTVHLRRDNGSESKHTFLRPFSRDEPVKGSRVTITGIPGGGAGRVRGSFQTNLSGGVTVKVHEPSPAAKPVASGDEKLASTILDTAQAVDVSRGGTSTRAVMVSSRLTAASLALRAGDKETAASHLAHAHVTATGSAASQRVPQVMLQGAGSAGPAIKGHIDALRGAPAPKPVRPAKPKPLKPGEERVNAEGEHQGVKWQDVTRRPPGVLSDVRSWRLDYQGQSAQKLHRGETPEQASAGYRAEVDQGRQRAAEAEQRQANALRETARAQIGADQARQARNPLSYSEVLDAYRAANLRDAPMSMQRRWAQSGVTHAEHTSGWYQAALRRKAGVRLTGQGGADEVALSTLHAAGAMAQVHGYLRTVGARREEVRPYEEVRPREGGALGRVQDALSRVRQAAYGATGSPAGGLGEAVRETARNLPWGSLLPGHYGAAAHSLHDAADAIDAGRHKDASGHLSNAASHVQGVQSRAQTPREQQTALLHAHRVTRHQVALEYLLAQAGPNPHGAAGAIYK